VVIAPDGGEVAAHSGFIGHGTNQIAEITAAIEGLSRTPEGAQVELVSDSQYVLKGMTDWRAGWERKGFRNSKGEPVANLALWKQLFALADKRRVTTRWVRGHNGDFHNEQADQLATAALRKARAAGPVAAAGSAVGTAGSAVGTSGDYTLPRE
jgi:ribonuclease HI